MRILHLLLLCALLAISTGCLMSEQIGEPIGEGRNQKPAEDVVFHFDTDFNKALIFGRSVLLLIVAIWIFKSWGTKGLSALVGGALLATAGFLFLKDFRVMNDYYLEVAAPGLTLRVPPDLDVLVPWQSVDELWLAGAPYARVGGEMTLTPWGGVSTSAGAELPDLATMTITLTGGESYVINLKALSIEHRQIFAKALIKRADLVPVE